MKPRILVLVAGLTSCVNVDHSAYDPAANCWFETTSSRPLKWWHGYGGGACDDMAWTAVDGDGTCIWMHGWCNEVADQDPHLSDCDAFPDCCSAAVREAPSCPP